MQEESIVREVEISDGSQTYSARYYVERGVLHARIGDRMISLTVGAQTSDEAVRRLLAGHIQTKTWRKRLAARWFGTGLPR